MIACVSWSYSYSLRLPLGLSTPALKLSATARQVTPPPARYSPRREPSYPFSSRISSGVLPLLRRRRSQRVRADRRRGPARRDTRQAGHVHLTRRDALFRLRDHCRNADPVGARQAQGREEQGADAAADRLVAELVTYERR